jgi:hypothetical protein
MTSDRRDVDGQPAVVGGVELDRRAGARRSRGAVLALVQESERRQVEEVEEVEVEETKKDKRSKDVRKNRLIKHRGSSR